MCVLTFYVNCYIINIYQFEGGLIMPTKEVATREEMLMLFSYPETFSWLANSFYQNTLNPKHKAFLIDNGLTTPDGKMLSLCNIFRLFE